MIRISQVVGRPGVERCVSSSWSSILQNGRVESLLGRTLLNIGSSEPILVDFTLERLAGGGSKLDVGCNEACCSNVLDLYEMG